MVRSQKTETRGRHWPQPLLGFLWKRQDRVNALRLASLNNFSRFQTTKVVPSCLAPGPGMIKPEKYYLLFFCLHFPYLFFNCVKVFFLIDQLLADFISFSI